MTTDFDTCALCGGNKKEGSTTFTVDFNESLVIVRDVVASFYALCGNE